MLVLGGGWITWKALERRREARYASELKAYSEAVHEGTTRRDVEAYLRSRKVEFRLARTSYNDRQESQRADLVEIDDGAWRWLIGQYVYVAFEFVRDNQFDATDLSPLERVELFRVSDILL